MSNGSRGSAGSRRRDVMLRRAEATRAAGQAFADKHGARIERESDATQRDYERAAARADEQHADFIDAMDDAVGGDVSEEEVDAALKRMGIHTSTHDSTPPPGRSARRGPSSASVAATRDALLAEAARANPSPDLENTSPRDMAVSAGEDLESIRDGAARETRIATQEATSLAQETTKEIAESMGPAAEEKPKNLFQRFGSWIGKKVNQAYNAVRDAFGLGNKEERELTEASTSLTRAAESMIQKANAERQKARAAEREARKQQRAEINAARKAQRAAKREAEKAQLQQKRATRGAGKTRSGSSRLASRWRKLDRKKAAHEQMQHRVLARLKRMTSAASQAGELFSKLPRITGKGKISGRGR